MSADVLRVCPKCKSEWFEFPEHPLSQCPSPLCRSKITKDRIEKAIDDAFEKKDW